MLTHNQLLAYKHLRAVGYGITTCLHGARNWRPEFMAERRYEVYDTKSLELAYAYLHQEEGLKGHPALAREVWYECYRAARMA